MINENNEVMLTMIIIKLTCISSSTGMLAHIAAYIYASSTHAPITLQMHSCAYLSILSVFVRWTFSLCMLRA